MKNLYNFAFPNLYSKLLGHLLKVFNLISHTVGRCIKQYAGEFIMRITGFDNISHRIHYLLIPLLKTRRMGPPEACAINCSL